MDTGHHDAAIFHATRAAVRSDLVARRERFERLRPSYDRFYDLRSQIGDAAAREVLPEEATVVDEFEGSHGDPAEQTAKIAEARIKALEVHVRSLASSSLEADGSIIGRLRSDLLALDEFRFAHLDQVRGRFWEVFAQGNGVDPKEKSRMINRVLAAWCEVYELKPVTMHKAVWALSKLPSSENYGITPAMQAAFTAAADAYPFDLATDIAEAGSWGDKDAEFIAAILSHHAHTGDWGLGAPATSPRR